MHVAPNVQLHNIIIQKLLANTDHLSLNLKVWNSCFSAVRFGVFITDLAGKNNNWVIIINSYR